MIVRALTCFLFFLSVHLLAAQCPTSLFTIEKDDYCEGELISVSNGSVNGAVKYDWDFCGGDFVSAINYTSQELVTISGASKPRGIGMVQDSGLWYSFITSRDNNKLYRVEHGESLDNNDVTVYDVGTDPLYDFISNITFQRFPSGDLYGVVVNRDREDLLILEFPDGIQGQPTVRSLPIPGVSLFRTRMLQFVEDGEDQYLMLPNEGYDELILIDFGPSSIPSEILAEDVYVYDFTGIASWPHSVSAIRECDEWYVLMSSRNTSEVLKLNFGQSLLDGYDSYDVLSDVGSPGSVRLLDDKGRYYGLIVDVSGSLSLYNFGSSLSGGFDSNKLEDIGTLGVLSNTFNMVFAKDVSLWRGFSINESSNVLYKVNLDGVECGSSLITSEEYLPEEISYQTSGTKYISLTVTDVNGRTDHYSDSIVVSSSTAPDIDFSIDANRCVTNSNTFTSINSSGDITSYSWDFNGDDVEDSTDPIPEVSFDTLGGAGTYTVRLEVTSSGGCSNFVEKEITIYEEPPVPSFDYTVTSECTNSEFSFTNSTDETGYEGVLSYQWVIDGDTVDQRDTTYVFTTSGEKIISLQSILTGCLSAVYRDTIAVLEGPSVSYNYTNNCYGEAINFTSEVFGDNLTNYSWDFGDGGSSSAVDTTYQYASSGTYQVSLTVSNSAGCITSYQQELTVNDQPLLSMSVGEAIENLPVTFNGEDLTLSGDSVVSWLWTIGITDYEGQQITTVFDNPQEDLPVTLSITTIQGCSQELDTTFSISAAQCPTSLFTIEKDDYCEGELISVSNGSVNGAVKYDWDFCGGDFVSAINYTSQELVTISGASKPRGIGMVQDSGLWYSFITSRDNNKLYRVEHGESLDNNDVTVYDVGTDPLYDFISNITFQRFPSGDLYGVVVNRDREDLLILEFPDGIQGQPTVRSLPIPGVSLFRTRMLQFVEDGEDQYLMLPNEGYDELILIDFGPSSIPSEILAEDVYVYDFTGIASWPHSVSAIRECDEWYVLMSSRNTSEVLKLNFGQSLLDGYDSYDVLSDVGSPGSVRLLDDKGRYYGLIVDVSGSLSLYNFGSSLSGGFDSNKLEDIGTLGVLSNTFNMVFAKDVSLWRGFSINESSNVLYKVNLDGVECGSSLITSEEYLPEEISYQTSGTKYISLTVTDVNGRTDHYSDSIVVSSSTAPDIDFSIDANRCVTNSNTFTSINSSGDITSYSWDFNGDDVEDSTDPIPEVSFDTLGGAGTYTVRLEVTSSGGCSNFVEKEITIYEEPPVPSFDYTVTSECTNSEFSFTNSTDETGYEGVLSYQWVIDGDTVDQRDTTYVFTTSGEKIISLQSILTGCLSAVYRDTIAVLEGPSVSYNYTNNCYGEAINFTSEVFGDNLTNYSWDFGDGGSSSAVDTTYQYASSGTYQVSLTVSNSAGCITSYQQELTVNDQPLLSMSVGEAIENLPVTFNGEDLTLSGDSVVSWLWTIGITDYEGQQITTVFDNPQEDLPVTLSITTIQGCSQELDTTFSISAAQCPTSLFTIEKDDYCEGELISVSNGSVNGAVKYDWDFCGGDFVSAINYTSQELVTISGASKPRGIGMVQDSGLWYSFITSRDNNKLYRVEHGESLDNNDVTVYDVGTDPLYDFISNITFQRFPSGDLYGVVVNRDREDLLILEFPDGIQGQPTVRSLPIPGVSLFRTRMLQFVEDGEDQYLMLPNEGYDELILIDFGPSSIPSEILAEDVYVYDFTGIASWPHSVSAIRECDEWYVLMSSRNTSEVLKLNFGQSLLDGYDSYDVLSDVGSPGSVRLLDDKGRYYGLIVDVSGSLSLYNFGSSLSGGFDSNKLEDIGTLGVLSNTFNMVFAKDVSLWRGFSINESSNVLYKVNLDGVECGSSLITSEEYLPEEISYQTSGTKYISLTVTDVNGRTDHYSDSIVVSSSTAPDIDFSIDANRCVTNSNTFTSINSSGDITSYSWDFNGDDVEDSTGPNPEVLFDTLGGAGTYTVRLEVTSSGGCSNFVEREVTIYEEPPVPSFEVNASTYCIGSEITFENTTDDAAYTGGIQYHWQITGLADTVTTSDLTATFNISGQKIISVYASIPGCESEIYQDTIVITSLPEMAFDPSTTCDGEVMTFSNQSEGNTFRWDFGDGYISTQSSPDHLYVAAGTYTVTLESTDGNGCTNSKTDVVEVAAIPQPEFEYDIVCQGSETILQDVSIVNDADIEQWEWFVDGQMVSNQRNPGLVFDSDGDQNVTLVVYSSSGCSATYTESIDVLAKPEVVIASDLACLGDTSTFYDESTNKNALINRMWRINGILLNQSGPELNYLFKDPGTYEVTLSVDNANLCTASRTQLVEVLAAPQLGFSQNNSCENELVTVSDTSMMFNDPIVSRKWYVNDKLIGTGPEALLPSLENGSYSVTLQVQTEYGCSIEQEQEVVLTSKPDLSFSLSNDYGIPPFSLSTENYSTLGTEYYWYVNGDLVSNAFEPLLAFSEVGNQEVKLLAVSADGCLDSTTTVVRSITPVVDVGISSLQLIENATGQSILLDIFNRSNLPVDSLEAKIILENDFELSETIVKRINDGEDTRVRLNVNLPVSSKLSYLCVSLTTPYAVEDQDQLNNEQCINIENETVFEPAFPNPASDRSSIRAVIPSAGDITVTILDLSGQAKQVKVLENHPAGLTTFTFDVSRFDAGTYFVLINYQGGIHKARIIKQ
ncbi:PKD domain-containing protein [Marinoscillum sp.]|uniref:PKD domain-containing protein n=1 Tax=Marinoscillum sp. TaxID=2024838 RepID=UPI003BAB6882